RLLQQRVEVHAPRAEFLLGLRVLVRVVVQHLHVPAGAAALRQGVADAAHADDAERPPGEVLPEVAERLPRLPEAGLPVLVAVPRGAACRCGGPPRGRRAAPISRQNAMSAVASVSPPGVLPTATPRAVAAGTSMLLKPTA